MADDALILAAGFGPQSRDAWLALVEKTLKGGGIDDMTSTTRDGLAIRALYEDGPAAPVRKGPIKGDRPWDIRAFVAHPDPRRANSDLLADLEGGSVSGLVRIDPTGRDGVAVCDREDLAQTLDGVLVDLAPIGLDAGFLGPRAATWLADIAKGAPAAPLHFHLDPIGAFAVAGTSPGPIEAHVAEAASSAARLARTYPKAGLFLASGRVVHEAGGSEALELAFALSCGLAYAKAMDAAGGEDPFSGVVLGLSAGSEYFVTLAKLRAARVLWAKVAGRTAVIEARSSQRMLAALDVWTNLLRLSAAGFGAATGGADAIVLGTYTDALGRPTAFARRQARNTQLVLMEESHLGRVADPAGGAWFLESLTDDLARTAWKQFQAIEAAGGAAAALKSGLIARAVAETANSDSDAIAAGKRHILGVTKFRNAAPGDIDVEPADPLPSRKPAPDVALAGADSTCPALTPARLAQAFEAA